jgi:tRNA(fMet)-specific endonuclease VapC
LSYLLDTDHCAYWMNGRLEIRQKIQEIGWEEIAVSAVTVGELFFGAYKSQQVEKNIERIEDFLSRVKIIELNMASGMAFGQLKASLVRIGQVLPDADLMIAATAQLTDRVLVSNNIRHFSRIPNLTFENWSVL